MVVLAFNIEYVYDGCGPYKALIDGVTCEQEAIAQLKKRVTNPHLIQINSIYET